MSELKPTTTDVELIERVARQYLPLKYLVGLFSSRVYNQDTAQVMVGRILRWEERNGFDPEVDLALACRQLVSPQVCARIRTEADLLAEFAGAVTAVLADKKRREENAACKKPEPKEFFGFDESQRVLMGMTDRMAEHVGLRVGGNSRGESSKRERAAGEGAAQAEAKGQG